MMKVLIITLGCKVNTYESDAIKDMFISYGDEIVSDDTFDAAIINTCTVTNEASKKSRKMIRSVIKKNPNAIVGVIGCYSQTYSEDLKEIKGIDFVLGNVDKIEIVSLIHNLKEKKDTLFKIKDILRHKEFDNLNPTSFTHTRAFLKIEDGCNNFCTYCIIPYSRGPVRSKKATDVIKDINNIVSNGYKEVVLTGIHTGRYQDQDIDFTKLIKMILDETKLERIRISSIEPNEVIDDFILMMKDNPRIARHLHIPLQAGSDHVLKLMNRKYDKAFYINKISKIQSLIPDVAITTDIIVGFPEESDTDFKETIELSKELGFAKIHVFPFSLREGTKACNLVQVKDQIKEERVQELLALNKILEDKFFESMVGKDEDIIIEEMKDGMYIGHSSNFLPVYIDVRDVNKGDMIKVRITKYQDNKLIGEMIC